MNKLTFGIDLEDSYFSYRYYLNQDYLLYLLQDYFGQITSDI